MYSSQDFWISLIAFLVVALLIFLAFRAFMLWYWKINVIVDRLDKILNALQNLHTGKS